MNHPTSHMGRLGTRFHRAAGSGVSSAQKSPLKGFRDAPGKLTSTGRIPYFTNHTVSLKSAFLSSRKSPSSADEKKLKISPKHVVYKHTSAAQEMGNALEKGCTSYQHCCDQVWPVASSVRWGH